MHRHHIKPKHAGGTDDPSNIVHLTAEEHALAHKELYEKYGRWQDKLAYEGLLGLKDKEEIVREVARITHTGKIVSVESRAKMSAAKKGRIPWNKGKKRTEWLSNETIAQLDRTGIRHSETTKAKWKGRVNNPRGINK